MFEQEAYPTGPRPRCPRAPVLDGDRTRRSTRSTNRGPPSVCRSTRGNRRRPVMGSSSAMVGPVGCGSLATSWPPGECVGAANLIPPARDRRLTGTGRPRGWGTPPGRTPSQWRKPPVFPPLTYPNYRHRLMRDAACSATIHPAIWAPRPHGQLHGHSKPALPRTHPQRESARRPDRLSQGPRATSGASMMPG